MTTSPISEKAERAFLRAVVAATGAAPEIAFGIRFMGDGRQRSCFAAGELAAASIGAAWGTVAELAGTQAQTPDVMMDRRLAALWFGFSLRPLDWTLPAPWDPMAGDYPTADGWIKLHTNAPHHRAAALSVLDCAPEKEAVAEAVSRWNGEALEAAIIEAGGCSARLRTRSEWQKHPQGAAVAREPLIAWVSGTPGARRPDWRPNPLRPLAGLRVLDLTRVLAGPVATRFLAGFGAEVLRIDPREWDEPGVVAEVTPGKRCARLDLKTPEGRARFETLLAGADILVHGYRADALEQLGLGAERRAAIRPGLIDISLDAYGHSGPWRHRRGFDSLVQLACGIAAEGMAWSGSAAPLSLPFQALDQATGYLMAAAAVRGVTERLRTGHGCQARTSLARTAALLMSEAADPADAAFPNATDDDYADKIEQTAWGPSVRLKPPAIMGAIQHWWGSPAVPLGSSKAEW